jgi:MYXO-CTERM domain-containing protein
VLPQGGAVWGTASSIGTWPAELSALPPNRIIEQLSDSGSGKVIEDDSDAIAAALTNYNAGKSAQPSDGGCATRAGGRPGSILLAMAALGAAVLRRRRRLQRGP